MSLHRDLVLGKGFFHTLQPKAEAQLTTEPARALSLPAVKLLPASQRLIDALMEDVFPSDRDRLCAYLSKAPLGFGVITGGPGFGKTTVLSVATLGMSITLGPIYASAATDVATDNFAEHLNRISAKFTSRRNGARRQNENRVSRTLVIRGYYEEDEMYAFHSLLEHPEIGDKAAPPSSCSYKSEWRLHLSLAYWLLVALRSRAVRPLHPEDHAEIHLLRSYIDNRPDFKRLRNVAKGVIGYQEYKNGQMVPHSLIKSMFQRLLFNADILCTNTSLSCQYPYDYWKKKVARGIAVDEAGNISRPDLYSVWGNTLLPCLLCGDDRQLAPRMMSFGQRDDQGNSINRLEQDGKLSALLFFQANGWPVFRLRTQLRMATGLFDLNHREAYGDVSFEYGPDCNIHLDRHACGRELEAYLQKRFPELAPPPADSLFEAFINCRGSKCYFNSVTKSRWNPVQSKHALDFIRDLVTNTKVTPAEVFIITPHRANVEFIECERKKPDYSAISAMAPAATIDNFQGRQGNIVILVTTMTKRSQEGCISDEHYSSVMLSRHVSGLVIFGDFHMSGELDQSVSNGGEAEADKIAAQRKECERLKKTPTLGNLLHALMQKKRVAILQPATLRKAMVLLPSQNGKVTSNIS